jgi:hypothetical protein
MIEKADVDGRAGKEAPQKVGKNNIKEGIEKIAFIIGFLIVAYYGNLAT